MQATENEQHFNLTAHSTASSGGNTVLCLVQTTNDGTLGPMSRVLTNFIVSMCTTVVHDFGGTPLAPVVIHPQLLTTSSVQYVEYRCLSSSLCTHVVSHESMSKPTLTDRPVRGTELTVFPTMADLFVRGETGKTICAVSTGLLIARLRPVTNDLLDCSQLLYH